MRNRKIVLSFNEIILEPRLALDGATVDVTPVPPPEVVQNDPIPSDTGIDPMAAPPPPPEVVQNDPIPNDTGIDPMAAQLPDDSEYTVATPVQAVSAYTEPAPAPPPPSWIETQVSNVGSWISNTFNSALDAAINFMVADPNVGVTAPDPIGYTDNEYANPGP